MKPTYFENCSTSKGEFLEPLSFSKSKLSSGYELYPRFKAMVRAQPFSSYDHEDPFNHLQEFKEMCSCLSIPDMTQEILKRTLFPFSLMGEANQWYANAIQSANGDWDELQTSFILHSSSCLVSFLYQGQFSIWSKMRSP
jgi:hypothetical protein